MGACSSDAWKCVADVVRDRAEGLPSYTFECCVPPSRSKRGEGFVTNRVLDHVVHGGEGGARLWAVCEQTGYANPPGTGTVLWSERYIRLTLIEARGALFAKQMDEHVGPCFYDCPLRFLDLAGPLGPEITYAQPWRAKVREWHAKGGVFNVLKVPAISEVSTG